MILFDKIVILLYFTILLVMGVVTRQKEQSDETFLLAGRALSARWIGISAFASWVGLAGVFGTPENVYRYGLSGIWWFHAWLPGILMMAFFLAGRLRKRRVVTIADLFSSTHSPWVRGLASLVTSWSYLAWAAVQIFAILLILKSYTQMNSTAGAVVIYCFVMTFTLMGGMRWVVMSDGMQAILLIGVIMLIAPILLVKKAGSFSILFEKTAHIPDFYSLYKGAGFKTLLTWFLSLLPAAFIDPGGLQRVFAAKDSRTAERGLYLSVGIYFFFGLSITFLGMGARALLPEIDAARALPLLFSEMMPMGLEGLCVAAFLAIAMSTADTALLVVASTLQRDIYSLFRPDTTQRERIFVTRVLILILGALSLLIALKSGSIVTLLLLGFSIYVPGLLLPVISASYHLNISSRWIMMSIFLGAGGSASWNLMKEPVMPAILFGLLLSSGPFLIGWMASRQ